MNLETAFFAQRVINSFNGRSENEMKAMGAVLIGMNSYDGIEKFHHSLMHDLISFINKKACAYGKFRKITKVATKSPS